MAKKYRFTVNCTEDEYTTLKHLAQDKSLSQFVTDTLLHSDLTPLESDIIQALKKHGVIPE